MNEKKERKWLLLVFMLALSRKLFIDDQIYFICFIRSWVEVIQTYHLSFTYGLCYYDAIFINLLGLCLIYLFDIDERVVILSLGSVNSELFHMNILENQK